MKMEAYKDKIHVMVDEITNFNFIVQIYTVVHILYQKFKGNR